MVTRTYVKSFYSGMLVTCYEYNGVKYVANQHGNYDVYEGECERGGKKRVAHANSDEVKSLIALYKKTNPDR
ncbi:MAG TPA: hypothetical protein VLH56_12580 [Dissulfurispiraceae bacterium]|nr:hypothetical protein [Dissulfurispiraceae bacterium]